MLEGLEHSRRWVIFCLLIACHIYFFQIYPLFVSPNELSRLLLTSAIVDDHSISIDEAIKRFGDPQDKASFNGHFYSDKAIGASLSGIPAFLLLRMFELLTGLKFSAQMAIYWVRVFTITIPAILFAFVLSRFWRRLKPDSKYIPHFLFLHLFGTIAFTYSSLLVSHYLLGISLFGSAFFLNQYRLQQDRPVKCILLSGSLAGASLLMEFPAAVPVAVICVFAVMTLRNVRKVSYFALPIVPFVVLILGYNYLIFSNPWDVTYKHMTHPEHMTHHVEGLAGIGFPKLEALHGLLFSRHHGLFFISPFLLLSVGGFYRMLATETWTLLSKLSICIVLTTILTYSAFYNWIAGWNFGPRYLTPVVPFLSTAVFYYGDELMQKSSLHRTVVAAAGIWSVLCATAGTITFPFPPTNLLDPLFFLNFPLLFHGATGKNLAGNPWFFFVLLGCALLVMTLPKTVKQFDTSQFLRVLAPIGFASILFVVAFLSRPATSPMEYYARGSVYLYLGNYEQSLFEMQLALNAGPDSNTRALIQKRISDISRVLKR
ncbi:hypothetical protein L0222_16695 [bacterium]|nr:hypothetical protein [bacterium]MCI0605233.1 hypothetical protein [bacterium]